MTCKITISNYGTKIDVENRNLKGHRHSYHAQQVPIMHDAIEKRMNKSRSKITKKFKNRNGQSLVEFALLLPLLALLLFTIIQYGFIFSAYMTLRHGAHVTARTATMAGFNTSNTSNITSSASSAITPMLNAANLRPAILTQTTVGGLSAIKVQLIYDLPLIVKFVVPNASGNILTLSADATYRRN